MEGEGKFPCKECGCAFESASEFSDHFERSGFTITGCRTRPLAERLEDKLAEALGNESLSEA